MRNFLINIITNPLFALTTVIVIWGILYYLFIKVLSLSKIAWVRLEYFWITIGLLGVLFLVDQNRVQIQKNELVTIEKIIQNEFESLLSYCSRYDECFKYSYTGILSKEEFDYRQKRSDLVCDWVKEARERINISMKDGYSKISKLPELPLENKENEYAFARIDEDVTRLNESIDQCAELFKNINTTSWQGFKETFGVLFLLVAFGLRLTIVSYKIEKVKAK